MRFAMMMTIGVLVGSAQIPCGYEVTAIIQAPACPPFGRLTVDPKQKSVELNNPAKGPPF